MTSTEKKLLFSLFIFSLAIALFFVPQLGIGYDDILQIRIGMANIRYLFGDQGLLGFRDRAYGPTWEMILIGIEELRRYIFPSLPGAFLRHYIGFAIFSTGIFPLFFLAKKSKLTSVTAFFITIWYLLTPRVLADSFTNSKDIPFLVFFLWAIAVSYYGLDSKKKLFIILGAILTALAIATRIFGVMIPIVVLLMYFPPLLSEIVSKGQVNRKLLLSVTQYFLLFGIISVAFTYIFYPYLWTDPIRRFIEIIVRMKAFPWDGDILYNGIIYRPEKIPWHYLPSWIAISTPFLYIFYFGIGIFNYVRLLFKNLYAKIFTDKELWLHTGYLAWVCTPILGLIILHSVVYDAWRHVFFVYPAILLLAGSGLDFFYQKSKKVTIYIATVGTGIVLVSMTLICPLFNIYFSPVAQIIIPHIDRKFEVDYWGVSQAYIFNTLSEEVTEKEVHLYTNSLYSGLQTFTTMPPTDDLNLQITSISKAQYILDVFRTRQFSPPTHCSRQKEYRKFGIHYADLYKCAP